MAEKIRNMFKYISLVSLLIGIAIWVWYIIFIIILAKTPYGEILQTIPIGVVGIISGIISKNKKLVILNIIQTLALPILLLIASIQEAIELRNN